MMDCKAMDTPMVSNLKLWSDPSSKMVDVMMYHQMIGTLIHLTNTRPDICFDVNTLSQFLIDPRLDIFFFYEHLEPVPNRSKTCSLDCYKAYFEVTKGYNLLM